jgi:chromosomal replication initiator protein
MNAYIAPGVEMYRTPEEIKRRVCKVFGISEDKMLSRTHRPGIVVPRQVAMTIMYRRRKMTIQAIGKEFNRNHATVIYANKAVQNMIDTNDYKHELEQLKPLL